jgi:cysteinyl-tRNA synthetase
VAKGFAYAAEGHVLFEVAKMPGYGALSRRPLDDMIAGARVEVAPYKRSPMDFVLWKPSDPLTEPGWDSPWGFGRPGWHIECSAMSGALLGDQFDIHAGGLDLIFPHHENEIAQSCCAFGVEKMAGVWMHNGFLQVEGQKMSKSLGNFKTIQDVLKDWPGEVVRLNMLKTHYRQPIDWTVRGLEESERELERVAGYVLSYPKRYEDEAGKENRITSALLDDLNTPKALAEIHNSKRSDVIAEGLAVLGLSINQTSRVARENQHRLSNLEISISERITARLAARASKNFAESDRIRDELLTIGIQLKDGKDPITGAPVTTWEVKR